MKRTDGGRPPRAACLFLLGALALIPYAGCASFRFAAVAPGGRAMYESAAPLAAAELSLADRGSADGAAAVARTAAVAAAPVAESADAGRPAARLRVYSADVELVVTSLDASRQRLLALAESLGGYVEFSQADRLVLRVPAARFDEAVAAVCDEGPVRSRSISTTDVTEQYADLQRRLLIARASRDRLYALLKGSEDSEEQVLILRDIRRLTEEIEQLEGAMQSLSDLVSYSRITVRLSARVQTPAAGRQPWPFPWIARLDPLYPSVGPARAVVALAVPEQFAVFQEGRSLRAESAGGVRLRSGGRGNVPAGDPDFWVRALIHHLEPEYRSAEPVSFGGFAAVLFTSKDTSPFSYLVAVAVRGEELVVIECFFPDPKAFGDLYAGVRRMLEEASL